MAETRSVADASFAQFAASKVLFNDEPR